MTLDIAGWQKRVHANALDKGWWEDTPRHVLTEEIVPHIAAKLLMVHAEVSEAAEELRELRLKQWEDGGKPEGMVIELADVVIRVMDLCGYLGLDLEEAMWVKSTYNTTRGHRHGNKAL